MKHLIAAAFFAAAAPVAAQDQGPAADPPPAAAPAAPAIDPQRLALAESVALHIFPEGTYQRMMTVSMDSIMDTMLDSMLDMQMGDMLPEGSAEDREMEAEAGRKTMRELMAAEDPHFEERFRITNKVIAAEMAPIVTRLEPEMRSGLARAYARKFTAEQLTELNRFFATPVGHAYAAESMMLWVDPEITTLMGKMMPELVTEMPAIMEKVQAATAHLPMPEPRKGKSSRKKRG